MSLDDVTCDYCHAYLTKTGHVDLKTKILTTLHTT